jgi:hypothetical protein
VNALNVKLIRGCVQHRQYKNLPLDMFLRKFNLLSSKFVSLTSNLILLSHKLRGNRSAKDIRIKILNSFLISIHLICMPVHLVY